jgi:hypothetical protein
MGTSLRIAPEKQNNFNIQLGTYIELIAAIILKRKNFLKERLL